MTDSDAVSLKSQQRRRRRSSARDDGFGLVGLTLVWLYGFTVGSVIGILGVALYAFLAPAVDAAAEDTSPTPEPKADAVCYSPSCLATSEVLRENLNPLVAPCEDFQEHVCSRYWGPQPSLLLSELDVVLDSVARSLQNPGKSVRGARRKASNMFRACQIRYSDRRDQSVVLKEFMARLRLSISDPPPVGNLSTPDGLLKLHVELAFVYELSGLFFLRPAMPRSIRVAADLSFIHASEEYQKPDAYFQDLLHTISPASPELAKKGLELHNTMALTVAMATNHRDGPMSARVPHFVKVRDVSFGGVSAGSFAAAVEEKTPYNGDSLVELDSIVPSALEAVWKEVNSTDLYHWTSWQVLGQCAAHVDPLIASNANEYEPFSKCLQRVYLVLGPPAAAIQYLRLITPEVEDRVSRLIKNVGRCLTTKAARWVRQFEAKPVVGLPPSANTVQALDSRYESVPSGNWSSFFADWIHAAEMRSRRVSPDDVHLDERQADVSVSPEGHVVVPALFLTSRLFSSDGPAAVDYGSLGHTVARSMIRRFMRPNAPSVLPCVSPDASNGTDFTENLLAYSCVRSTFEAANEPVKRLPMLGVLHPAPRLLLAMGCLKDCAVRDSMTTTSCRVSERHLESFEETFSCNSEQQRCTMQ